MEKKKDIKYIDPGTLHKQQSVKQVLLPVVLAGVICLGVCLFLVISTSSEPQSTEQWAQISTMFLLIPAIFIGLGGLAILILLSGLFIKWNKNWPPALQNGREIIINIEKYIQGLAQKPAQPVIGIKSAWAGIKAIFKK